MDKAKQEQDYDRLPAVLKRLECWCRCGRRLRNMYWRQVPGYPGLWVAPVWMIVHMVPKTGCITVFI